MTATADHVDSLEVSSLRPFACPYKSCDCTYGRPGDLKKHLNFHSKRSVSSKAESSASPANTPPGTKKRFECPSCPFSSVSAGALGQHRKFHHKHVPKTNKSPAKAANSTLEPVGAVAGPSRSSRATHRAPAPYALRSPSPAFTDEPVQEPEQEDDGADVGMPSYYPNAALFRELATSRLRLSDPVFNRSCDERDFHRSFSEYDGMCAEWIRPGHPFSPRWSAIHIDSRRSSR